MTRALLAALALVLLLIAPTARAQDSDALTWARANSCQRIRDYIARYPGGRYLTQARAQLTARNCPAPQATAPADPCVQARADWAAIAASSDVSVLRAFRAAAPAACAVQRAQADARITAVQLAAMRPPSAGSPSRSTTQQPPERPAPQSAPRGAPPEATQAPEMVRIPGRNFALSRYEVTRGQWRAFVSDTGRSDPQVASNTHCTWRSPGFEQSDNHPVTCVSWEDVRAYTEWLSRRTGQRYRFPTAAEWEVAARAGTTSQFSWGDADPVCDMSAPNGANFRACANYGTRPVGSFQPNGFGLYDMHGNVWEWVEDCFSASCATREIRGGSWYDSSPQYLRSANRLGDSQAGRFNNGGVRLALSL